MKNPASGEAAVRFRRREFLRSTACGFGSLALAALASRDQAAAAELVRTHHRPRAKRVIFLFMAGGVSQVDSFDYKPLLEKRDGELLNFADARTLAKGEAKKNARLMKPLWRFQQRGESGKSTSDLFPEIGRYVDDLCFLHGMHTDGVAHGPATLFLHTGSTTQNRPSMGSWVSYGLGSANENLPAFVSLLPSSGNGGPRNYGSGFLPARHQGTAVGRAGIAAAAAKIRFLENPHRLPGIQKQQFDLVQALNREQFVSRGGNDSHLEAIIESYELAWRMQQHAPEVLNVDAETPETLGLYGIGSEPTDSFGRQCLMARRLAESGVRFIQVNYTDNSNNPAWDQHSNMPLHAKHARAVDRPIAGLLEDLKRRGLLDDTLVWWGSEFGRNPYAQNNGTGRDHNPNGFTVWLAGGGAKSAVSYGATDEFGHFAIDGRTHMHDLHATVLHLLGLDHERLTFRHAGRDFRLTDVSGRVIEEVLT